MCKSSRNSLRHGVPRSAWISSTQILFILLVSLTQISGSCTPCPNGCTCKAKADQSCKVDCTDASLTSVPPESTLPPAKDITELLLAKNSISALDPDAFIAFINLKILDLSSNSLSTLPEGILTPLKSNLAQINLASNPWNCDCGLTWLKKWIDANSNLVTSQASTQCSLPTAHTSKPFSNLAETDFTCASAPNNSLQRNKTVADGGLMRHLLEVMKTRDRNKMAVNSKANSNIWRGKAANQNNFRNTFGSGTVKRRLLGIFPPPRSPPRHQPRPVAHRPRLPERSSADAHSRPHSQLGVRTTRRPGNDSNPRSIRTPGPGQGPPRDGPRTSGSSEEDATHTEESHDPTTPTISTPTPRKRPRGRKDIKNIISCLLLKDTAETVPIIFEASRTPMNDRNKCNNDCFKKGSPYAIIYKAKCGCGKDAKTATCSCPDLTKAQAPNNGHTVCGKRYSSGAFKVTAGLNFGVVPVIPTLTPFPFSLTHNLERGGDMKYKWKFHGEYKTDIFENQEFMMNYNFLFSGVHNVTVTLTAGSGKEVVQIQVLVMSFTHGVLSCPAYSSTGAVLNGGIDSYALTTAAVQWTRTFEDATQITFPTSCENGGTLYQTDVCFTVQTTPLSWEEAESSCVKDGGHLMRINNDGLHKAVKGVLDTNSLTEVWIGLNDRSYEGHYTWTTGETLSKYKNWSPSQPDEGAPPEDCVVFKKIGATWTWHDKNCVEKRPYLCQTDFGTRAYGSTLTLTGAGQFGWGSTLFQINSATKVDSQRRKTVIIFPGLWSPENGMVAAWEFETSAISTETQLRLQIYSTSCKNPEEYVTQTGSSNAPSPYSTCDKDPPNYPSKPSCPSYQQHCRLDNTCKNITICCNCDTAKTSTSCATKPLRYKSGTPTYTLTAEAILKIPAGPAKLRRFRPTSRYTSKDHIIGISFDSDISPIRCEKNTQSNCRQNFLQATQDDWVTTGQSPKFDDVKWTDDQLCYLRVLTYTNRWTEFPSELTKAATLTKFGVYTFKATSRNALPKPYESTCKTTLEEPVQGLTLLSPILLKAGQKNPFPTVLDMGQTVRFILRISRGSHVTSDHIDGCTLSFTNKCTDYLSPTLCQSQPNEPAKPYLIAECRYSSHKVTPSKITFTVKNHVSSQSVELSVRVCQRLTGLTIKNNNTIIKVGVQASFIAKYATGTCAKFIWKRGTAVLKQSETTSALLYTFPNEGTFTLKVDASTPLPGNTLSASITVTVVAYADPRDLKFVSAPAGGFAGLPVQLKVSVMVRVQKSFTLAVKYGDGKHTELEAKATVSPYVSVFSHTYTSTGTYTLQVNASDAGSFKVKKHTIVVKMPVLSVQLKKDKVYFPTTKSSSFSASVSVTPTGYSLKYTWQVGTEAPKTTSASTQSHTFAIIGKYVVKVCVSTGYDSKCDSFTVTVEDEVTGLKLEVPNSVFVNLLATFSASVTGGTNVNFVYNTGVETRPKSTNKELSYTYKNPGTYTMKVKAGNNVNEMVDSKDITVYPRDFLNIERVVKPDGCSATNSELEMKVSVINASPETLIVTWYIEGGVFVNRGFFSVKHPFKQAGSFRLKVIVKSASKSVEQLFDVCIESPITGLKLTASTPVVPIGQGHSGNVDVQAEVTPSLKKLHYAWTLNGATQKTFEQAKKTYQLKVKGTYTLIVTVNNQVSSLTKTLVLKAHEVITGLKLSHSSNLVEGKFVQTSKELSFSSVITTGSDTTYRWDFGDGTIFEKAGATDQKHTYIQSGDYQFVLKVSNLVSSKSATLDIIVQDGVDGVTLIAKPDATDVNQPVSLECSATSGSDLKYLWKPCQSCSVTPGDSPSYSYSYSQVGTETASVTAFNKVSQKSATTSVTVVEKIVGLKIILGTGAVGYVKKGTKLQIGAECIRGSHATYAWTVTYNGGQNVKSSSKKTVQCVFDRLGEYRIKIVLSNVLGTEVATETIIVQEAVEGLKLAADKMFKEPNQNVKFTASKSAGSDLTYHWVFGDGNSKDTVVPNTQHGFSNTGTYSVILTAKNEVSGAQQSLDIGIEIRVADLKMSGCCSEVLVSGAKVQMQAGVGSGTKVSYSWRFTRGAVVVTLLGSTVTHAFPTDGQYLVKLTARNNINSLELEKTVKVQTKIDKVQIVLQQNKDNLFAGQVVKFRATTAIGSNFRYIWKVDNKEEKSTDSSLAKTFSDAGTYHVQVVVYNDVSSKTTTIVVSIRKLLCQMPKLNKMPSAKSEIFKSKEHFLEVDVDTGGCVQYSVEYTWTVHASNACPDVTPGSEIPLPTKVKLTNSLLHLPGGVLSLGTYCVKVKVHYKDTPFEVSASFVVDVKASPLVSVISGGSQRLVGDGEKVTIASECFDPDDPTGMSGSLTYSWTCEANPATANMASCFEQPTNGATLTVPTSSLSAGTKYTFTLTVSKGGRTAVFKQNVIVKKAGTPSVSVTCHSCRSTGSFNVIQGRRTVMVGTCSNCDKRKATFLWSVTNKDEKELVIDKSNSPTGANLLNFVLKAGALDAAQAYKVKLTVKDLDSNAEGYAEIELKGSLIPQGVTCDITPSTTAVLTDPISINCTGALTSGRHNRYRTSMAYGDTKMVLYYGLSPRTSVYLSHVGTAATSTATLTVSLETPDGAVKEITSSAVSVRELELPQGTTRSAFLVQKVKSVFTALKLKKDTVRLLQYSMALVTELNKDTDSGAKEIADRMFIRQCLLEGLVASEVSSLEMAGVVALVMESVTQVKSEFQTKNNEVTSILKGLQRFVAGKEDYSSDFAVSNPHSLARAVGNVIHALENEIVAKVQLLDIIDMGHKIFLSYILSKLSGEGPVTFSTTSFKYIAHKEKVGALPKSITTGHGAFFLNPAKVLNSKISETVMAVTAYKSNPLSWGVDEGSPITSNAAALTFFNLDKSEINVENLDDKIVLYLFSNGTSAFDVHPNTTFNPVLGLSYTKFPLLSQKSKRIVLNPDSSWVRSALHVQLRFSVDNLGSVPPESVSLDAFLGIGIEPDDQSFTDYKNITLASLELTKDHRVYTFFISQSSFDPSKSHVILVKNPNSMDVQVSVGFYNSHCLYYDNESDQWLGDGLNATDRSVPEVTVCEGNHLTMFGASVLVPLSAIDIRDIVNLDLSANPVVISFSAAILLLYLLLIIWARRSDVADEKKAAVVPLCGKDGPYRYEISVHTGMMPGAGTTAQVGIKLYGENGKGDPKHLYRPYAFQRNGHDVLIIASERNLGNIWQIRVWHDNTGTHPSWFLSHVIVRDLQTSGHWYFPVSSWLTINAPYGVVEKKVKAASSEELAKFSLRFRNEAASGFSEKHIWMSLFEHRDQSRFTRVQRLTCCVTLFYTFMCANAMWYGVVKNQDVRMEGLWTDNFSWEELVVGVLSSLMVFPINLAIMQIFRKSRFRLDPMKRQPKYETVEMVDLCRPPRQGSIIYDNNGNPCRLKRTEALMKIIRETSSSDSLRTKDTSDIGTWSSTSRSSSAKHREDLAKKLQLNGDDPKLWSYDSILQWPEVLPRWKENEKESPPIRPERRRTSTNDSGNDSPEKSDGKRQGKRPSFAWAARRMSLDTLLRMCEEELNEEEKTKRVDVEKGEKRMDRRASGPAENTRKFSLPRRSRRVSTNTNVSMNTDAVQNTEDDVWSSHLTEFSEVSDFDFGSRRTTLASDGCDRRSTFCRNASEGEFSLGREETFDLDSASMVRSSSIFASYGSRSFTSNSSGHSKLTRATSQSLIRIPQIPKRKVRLLPHWCVYIAYALCATLSAISIIVTLLYGHKFGRDMALKWLLALFISFFQSAFVTEPLKVLFIAIFLSIVTKQADQRVEDNVEVAPILQSNETIKEEKMKPIKGFALMQALDEGRKVHRMQIIIRQTVAYLFVIWLVFAVNYANHDVKAYYLSENIHSSITKSIFGSGRTLKSMLSPLEIWPWLETVVAPFVHSRNTTESYLLLLGVVRLRQVRSKPSNCTVVYSDILNARFRPDGCYGKRLFDVDTKTYDFQWQENVSGQWKHEDIPDWITRGTYANYDGKGYVQYLGTNLVDTVTSITNLNSNRWIDERSRALFVDFTIYNANTDLYSAVKILIEMGGHAGMVASIDIKTHHLFSFTLKVFHYYFVFMALLFAIFIYLLTHISLTIKEQRKAFVKKVWNWVDLTMLAVMASSVSMYIFLLVYSTNLLADQVKDLTTYKDFGPVAYHHSAFKGLNALLLFLLLSKIAQQFRFIKCWSNYGKTIRKSIRCLLWIFLLFGLLWLIFAMVGYLMLGPEVYDFRSYGSTLLTLLLAIRGHLDFIAPYTAHPAFTAIFFFSFIFFAFGMVFALIVAVLRKAFRLSKARTKYRCTLDTQDYEMIEFMLERFKVWAGITKPRKVSRSFRKVKFKGMPSVSTRSTYSSNAPSSSSDNSASSGNSGSSVSTTSFEALERICKESQYHDQMVERVVPSLEEVTAKLDKIIQDDQEEARICSEIARQLIKSSYESNEEETRPKMMKHGWRARNTATNFIYSTDVKSKMQPLEPIGVLELPPKQPIGIMKKPPQPQPEQQLVTVKSKPTHRPRTTLQRGRVGAAGSKGQTGFSQTGQRGSISTTISDASQGSKQSSSSRSGVSSTSNGSRNSNKSEQSHMSLLSIKSTSSSESSGPVKSVRYTADTKPPVPPPKVSTTRQSLPGCLQTTPVNDERPTTSTRPSGARARRPQHALRQTISKTAW